MASGKQISFSYGEISQSIQYKSNAVAFGEGLAQLTNAYVRSEGGFSNRMGFKYLATLGSAVTDPGLLYQQQKSKLLFTVMDAGENINRVLGYSRVLRFNNPTYVGGSSPATNGSFTVYDRDGGSYSVSTTSGSIPFPDSERSLGGDPRRVQLIQIGQQILCTFGESLASIRNYLYGISYGSSVFYRDPFSVNFQANYGATTINIAVTGSAPVDLPVTYLVMAETESGEEIYWFHFTGVGHPHSLLNTRIYSSGGALTFPGSLKSINVYRSAGTLNSAFALVGRIALNDSTLTSIDFRDFVIAGDISNAPPINPRLWGKQYGASPATDFKGRFALRAVRRVMNFQQRLFVAYDPNENVDMPEGTIGVSKLGAPKQLHAPDIYNSVDAFEFKIPVTSGAKILHMVPMERALIFTSVSVIMLKGSGEQGFITPTEVNPSVIFFEGSSEWVEPKVSGSFCFFLTPSHKNIMAVQMKGNEYEVSDISSLSSHLLKQEIIQIEVTTGEETILWCLRRDGKLISATLGAGKFGFALHETDGLITSISKFTRKKDFGPTGNYVSTGYTSAIMDYDSTEEECIAIQVLRDVNGVRNLYLESIIPRIDEDNAEEGFGFSDSFKTFGARLTLAQNGKHVAFRTSEEGWDNGLYSLEWERPQVNIQDGTTYEMGDLVNLRCGSNYNLLGIVPYVDFYYDEDITDERDGGTRTIKRTIRFERNGSPVWDGVKLLVPGFFQQDVPAILQDVTTQNPSNILALQTRYCFPRRVLDVAHLAGKEVSVFADGQVLSSPNSPDPNKPATLTVAVDGTLDLGDYYGYAVVGLPYTMTMQSLDIEPADNRTLTDSNKCISAIGVALENTRGGYFASSGAKLDDSRFQALEYRDSENMDDPDRNYSGYANIPIQSSWDNRGRAAIRQYDPLPISVLSIYPKGVSSGE